MVPQAETLKVFQDSPKVEDGNPTPVSTFPVNCCDPSDQLGLGAAPSGATKTGNLSCLCVDIR